MISKDKHFIITMIMMILGIYICNRWLIVQTNVHLLFDNNPAELGFFRLANQTGWIGFGELLDAETRFQFCKESRSVGDQQHGTLGLAALLLGWSILFGGLEASTLTLKKLSIGISAVGLLGWCVLLVCLCHKSQRTKVLIIFAVLYIFSPPVFLKLSMLYWGTHDLVIVGCAFLFVLYLPRKISLDSNVSVMKEACLFGMIGGCFLILNYAFLMPLTALLIWNSCTRLPSVATELEKYIRMMLFLGSTILVFLMTVTLIFHTGWFECMEFPHAINWEYFLGLSGKDGTAFFTRTSNDIWDISHWKQVWFQGFLFWDVAWIFWDDVTPFSRDYHLGGWIEIVIFSIVIWVLWENVKMNQKTKSNSAAVFFTLYILIAWLGIGVLQINYTITDEPTEISARYYTHLYPVSFAVIAIWGASGRWHMRMLFLLVLLIPAIKTNNQHIDWSNPEAYRRYDGIRLYFFKRDEQAPYNAPMSWASNNFIRGYSLIEEYQSTSYWTYWHPKDLKDMDHLLITQSFLSNHKDVDKTSDFWMGFGYALRILHPPNHCTWNETIIKKYPEYSNWIEEGYFLPPL